MGSWTNDFRNTGTIDHKELAMNDPHARSPNEDQKPHHTPCGCTDGQICAQCANAFLEGLFHLEEMLSREDEESREPKDKGADTSLA